MRTSSGPGALGEFLIARRARLRPDALGLRPSGRRRVPGLRREELAAAAGVSAPYYARLEQGSSRHASPAVLDALARALRLDPAERSHLHELATAARRPAEPDAETVAPGLGQLLAALSGVPAIVLGRRLDVLAWNPLGHALVATHLDRAAVDDPARRPNNARLVFTDPRTAELHPDRVGKTRAVVGHLRMVAGCRPGDSALATLVRELRASSSDFDLLWTDHTVGVCTGGPRLLHHPLVGAITVDQQSLHPAGPDGQSLVTFTTAPGSESRRALRRLHALVESPAARSGGTGRDG